MFWVWLFCSFIAFLLVYSLAMFKQISPVFKSVIYLDIEPQHGAYSFHWELLVWCIRQQKKRFLVTVFASVLWRPLMFLLLAPLTTSHSAHWLYFVMTAHVFWFKDSFTNIKPSWINEYRIERVKESSLSLWWSLENIFRLFGPQYHNTIPECPLKKSGSKSDPVLL